MRVRILAGVASAVLFKAALLFWSLRVAKAPQSGGGVTDHGALTGLADDDHPQYQLAATAATDAELAAAVAGLQPLDSDLTAIAALATTPFGRGLLILANQAALLSAAGAAAASHAHAGEDITSGTVADLRIAATITRDSEMAAYAQPLDSDLTAIAALTTTAFGRSVLELANAAALRTLAGLVIGTDIPSQAAFDDHNTRHENGGPDEMSIAGLDGVSTELAAHIADATAAHPASAVAVTPFGTIAATTVQAALEEIVAEASGGVTDHGALTGLADDDHTQYVATAPASSARNVIQPTAGGVIAAILQAHAAQSVDIFRVEDSAGLGYVRVGLAGTLAVGGVTGNDLATYGVYPVAAVISRGGTYYDADGGPQMTPGNAQAAVLSFFDQELLPTVDTSLGGFGIGASSRLGLTTRPIESLQGTFVEAISRGTRASGTPQIGRAFGVTGWVGYYDGAATGDITLAAGINGEVIHYGAGVIADGAIFYSDPQSFQASTGPITRLHGLLLGNMGRAGVATSYGIRVRAQSGAGTASYAVVIEGGKSVFTDGLVIALIAAPADAAYANGEGGWWWDQANSLPKWKGKTSGGVVVNATPYVVGGTDVALADGGTGSSTAAGARTNLGAQAQDADLDAIAALADPNADRILFWDDSLGAYTFLTPGTGLTITGTTIDAAGGGGSGELLERDIAQVGHGLSVGNVVRHNGTIFVKAQANSETNAEVVGIVSAVADADNFTLHYGGRITGLSGLTAGTVYFLDDDTAGLLTATEPTDVGDVSKPLLLADSTTSGYFFNYRGQVLAAAGDLDAHLTETADAHDASAVSFVPAGTIAATNVQAAIEEVASEAGGGAPTTATYITQTADAGLSAEQALSALATGLVKNTTGTGVLSIGAQGTDYYAPGGTDVAVADGGTGASTAAGARTNLGAQAQDADLDAIAALADPNADRILFWDDSLGAYTFLTPGTNLTITGTTIDAAGGGGATVDVQTFEAGAGQTWTKPSGVTAVEVVCIGAGGGGGGGQNGANVTGGAGGAGGAKSAQIFRAADIGATETVTVGAGGAGGVAQGQVGGNGGLSSFGSHLKAGGGGGGNASNGTASGGGGGSTVNSGALNAAGAPGSATPSGGAGGTGSTGHGVSSEFGGAAGGAATNTVQAGRNGGDAIQGGPGGGGGGGNGTPQNGGPGGGVQAYSTGGGGGAAGGTGGGTGTAGTAGSAGAGTRCGTGGGGGGASSGANGGNGGAGGTPGAGGGGAGSGASTTGGTGGAGGGGRVVVISW